VVCEESNLDSSGGASVGGAVTSWLVDKVPGEDGGVLAVSNPSDGVVVCGQGLHVVLVQLNGRGVCEKVVAGEGCGCVVCVVAPASR
jgi:hypothetical protein